MSWKPEHAQINSQYKNAMETHSQKTEFKREWHYLEVSTFSWENNNKIVSMVTMKMETTPK